jgi:hypothetical protein
MNKIEKVNDKTNNFAKEQTWLPQNTLPEVGPQFK